MCSRCAIQDDLLHVNDEAVCLTCISKYNIAPHLTDEQEKKLIADCECIQYSRLVNSLSLVSAIRLHGFFVEECIRYYAIGDLIFYDLPTQPVARLFYNHLILWF